MIFRDRILKLNLFFSGLLTVFLCNAQSAGITVTTIAGTGEIGYKDGIAAKATFKYPQGIAVDDSANVFVADLGNEAIRKIIPIGIVTTMAGNVIANNLAFGSDGDLYFCGRQQIRKLSKNGTLAKIAGNGRPFPFADGNATTATFSNLTGIAIDRSGNIYVADYGHNLIRKITPNGMVSTVGADTSKSLNLYGDRPYGDKTPPVFQYPSGIAIDSKGNIYVSEAYKNRILKISIDSKVEIFAGNGESDSTDGKGTKACFNWPHGLAIDSHDNLYVSDAGNNKIRMITPDGVVTTLAGNGDYGDEDGEGSTASFNQPDAIAVDKLNNIYVAELKNNKIRKITFDYDNYLRKRLEVLKINDHHYQYDTTNDNPIDTAQYSGILFWNSSVDTIGRFGPSYIDTFTEGGVKFRFVQIYKKKKKSHLATLERYSDGKWIKGIQFEPLNHEGDFDHSDDINQDGYNDITHNLRFNTEVYFFDPEKKDFIDSATAVVNYGIYLIDTAKNIFCDFQEYKQMCGQIHSTLYTFRNFKRYDLFDFELFNCDQKKGPNIITKLNLRKDIYGEAESKKILRSIRLSKPIDIDDPNTPDDYFDYKKFWEKEYKRLLDFY